MGHRWHYLTRAHYYFAQAPNSFWVCAPRLRWQRATEYVVVLGDAEPVRVTREQFIYLDARLYADAVTSLDEVIALLESDPPDGDYDDFGKYEDETEDDES